MYTTFMEDSLTMKKFKRMIALLLALLALPMCLFACEEGSKGNEEGTIDPNDTTDGFRIDINVRSLPTAEGELGDFFIKTGKDFRVEPGTTLLAALDALCAERSATYVIDTAGDFASFTFDGSTIEAKTEKVTGKENTFVATSFKVTVNGTEVKNISEYALNHNDVVEIFLAKGEEFTATE